MVAAIFLLVVLAALGTLMLTFSNTQQLTSAQDVQGSRAYWAARAGIEWGIYQVLDPGNTTAVAPADPGWPNLPACPAPTSLSLEPFAVMVTCNRSDYQENGSIKSIAVYRFEATASTGTAGSPNFIERRLLATVSKCRASDAAAPAYACS